MVEAPTILVVEDDVAIRELVVSLLTAFGCRTMTASNGLEGLAITERAKIEGIVLDLEMPVMNGLTMLRRLRDRHHDIPVLIMSGKMYREVLVPLANDDAVEYMPKPFDPDDFQEKCYHLFAKALANPKPPRP